MPAGRLTGVNLALLLGLAAIWGTSFAFISIGLQSFSPVLFAALRFDIAFAAVLAVALVRRAAMRPSTRAQWAAIGIGAVLNVGAYHALLFWGQQFTTPAIAAVIVGLNPLLTTIASRAFLEDERVGWHGAVGLALGLAGVVALATLRPGAESLLDAKGVGELVIVGAIASWAVGSTLVRRTRHGMDVFAFTAWQMGLGAVLLHAGAFVFDAPLVAMWTPASIASLLYLALVASALGFIIYFTLLERIGPIRSNLVSHVAPAFAALAGFLFLGATLEARALVAFLLIAGGFFLVARRAPAK